MGIFQYLPLLESLDLSGNQIKELPVGIFQELSNLKSLDLSENQFEEFPLERIRRLPKLKHISIDRSIRNLNEVTSTLTSVGVRVEIFNPDPDNFLF